MMPYEPFGPAAGKSESEIETHAQIVIVGGGIMGVALLYHLAEEGCKDVLLIEKGELTSGSTWHAAGQCPSLVGDYSLAQIHAYSNALYPRLEEMTGQYVSWHASGGIRLALTEENVDWFRYMEGISKQIGFRMEIVGVEEIKKINPFFDTTGVLAGARTLDDGHADPSGLTNAMARGATNLGAKIVRHNRVIDINALPSGEWELITEKGTVIAGTVVNAAGCYARKIAQMVGTDLPILNIEHHYLVTGTVPEFQERDVEMPVMRDPYASAYLRQEQKSGLIGIYEHTDLAEAWSPNGFPDWSSDSELFPENLDRLMPWLERAMERLSIFENAGIKRIVNGAIPHSADGAPLLGPMAGLNNFWACCGSSFGIAQGAGCGKYLAQWMLHGDSEINMTGLDPRRFGTYIDGQYIRDKGFQDYGRTFFTPMPGEELPAGRGKRTSPLHEKLARQGCVHTESFGWERPKWFSTDGRDENYSYRRNNVFDIVRDECMAVRERIGVVDLTGFAKYDISGPDAESFLNRLSANRMPKKTGGIVLAHILSAGGRIASEVTVTRLSGEKFYLLSSVAAEVRDIDHLSSELADDEQVVIENVTDGRGVLVVAGPMSRDVLGQLTDVPLDNASFRWLSGQEVRIAGIELRALRVNYVGELGWELHPRIEDLEALYDAIWQAGRDSGIANFGLYAMNSLRLEKAYRGWGSELTNEVTMLDADMERFLKLDKEQFIGRAATLQQATEERTLQLIYFEVDATDSDVRGGEPIFRDGDCVGITTSGGYGHAVGKSLGFGYVPPGCAEIGTALAIGLLGEHRSATILADAAYDPTNLRLRA